MALTGNAKASFDKRDLYYRGARLVLESVECGVTSMRAHVEVDTIVGSNCIDVGLQLKRTFRPICDIQIAGENPSFVHDGMQPLIVPSLRAGTSIRRPRG